MNLVNGNGDILQIQNNMVYAWEAGATSWSAGSPAHMTDWKYAKLAESEDQNGNEWN